MVYNFGPFTLEPSERRLWGANGSRIELTVKAFDLLVLLVDRAGQLVTKDEILDVIWKDVSIAESNVTTTISMIRKALQEDPEHRYVETIPRKGYRFVSAVTFGQTGTGQEPPRATIPNDQRHSGSTGAFRLKMIAGFLTMAAAVAIVVVVGLWFWHTFRLATSETQLQNAIKLETAGDDKLALATLEEFLRAEPGSSEALLRAAWLCYEADNDDDAARYLARLGQLRTGGTGGAVSQEIRLNAEGLTQLLEGNGDEALTRFDLALALDPENTDDLFHIAEVATSEGDLDKADRALASCFRIDNLNPFCGFQRIETLTYEGHADLAIAEYNRLTRGGSKYPWFDEPAGYAELSIGDVGASANHFNALAASRHTFASTVHFRASQDGLAAIDAYQGKRIDSETKLKTALETAPSGYSRADYFLLMANINVLYGHVAEGKDALLNVAQLSHSGELAMSLAKTFAMAGDFVAARAVLREHKGGEAALGQSFPAAEQFVDGLEALQNRDLTIANAALGSSNRIDSSPETAYFLAQAEMQRNDWGEASGVLNGLLAQRGAIVIDGPAALIPLAEYDLIICYRKMGNESEASRHLATVAEIWNRADSDIKRLLAR